MKERSMDEYFSSLLKLVKEKDFSNVYGSVSKCFGGFVEIVGVKPFVGQMCIVNGYRNNVLTEVICVRKDSSIAMAFSKTVGISVEDRVELLPEKKHNKKPMYPEIGEVVDCFGSSYEGNKERRVEIEECSTINPFHRKLIKDQLITGVCAIDLFLPIGYGQRVGIFAGSGVGKTTLLGDVLKKSQAEINVIALIGERGREVKEFLEVILNPEVREKCVFIVSTAEESPLSKVRAAKLATNIASEHSRLGKNVLLVMDSITRLAHAQREIGIAAGEPSTARGYPPSVFSTIAELVEQAGSFSNSGSITGIYSVLVEGDDFMEPIADATRSYLDGHILLSRRLASHSIYPAIDIQNSVSRLYNSLTNDQEFKVISKARELILAKNQCDEMAEVGAYIKGQNLELDSKKEIGEKIQEMLASNGVLHKDKKSALHKLEEIVSQYDSRK